MRKPIIIFAVIYFILEFATIFLIFGWNAFGASDSKNGIQKIIEFFFSFPSKWLFKSSDSLLLYSIPNTIFWTLIFALLFFIWKKLKSKNLKPCH